MKAYIVKALLGAAGEMLMLILQMVVESHLLDKIVELAKAHVAKVAGDTSLDNAQKRQTALDGIKDDAKKLGVVAGESVLNLALELAVNALKAKKL